MLRTNAPTSPKMVYDFIYLGSSTNYKESCEIEVEQRKRSSYLFFIKLLTSGIGYMPPISTNVSNLTESWRSLLIQSLQISLGRQAIYVRLQFFFPNKDKKENPPPSNGAAILSKSHINEKSKKIWLEFVHRYATRTAALLDQ